MLFHNVKLHAGEDNKPPFNLAKNVINTIKKLSQLLKRLFIFVTMEVNDKLINKLAVLSRLRFNEDEKQTIKKDLEQMIHFVSKLQEVDTDEVPPLLHISQNVNCMRTDIAEGTISRQEALKNAALHDDMYFKVPKIIKK